MWLGPEESLLRRGITLSGEPIPRELMACSAEENGCELDTLRADRALCEAFCRKTGDVQSPAERTRGLPRGHDAAMVDTIACGDSSLVVRDSACHVWADDGNAPQAGQSPTSPSCALSLQPIPAKQREPLQDWFGYLLLARAVVSEFEPKLAAEDSYRPAMLELRTVHRGRWN